MFGTLFLGAVLAVFLTLGAVRGDAERGLFQPIVVRPLSRRQYLAGRFLAAATVAGGYVGVVSRRVVITGLRRLVAESPVGAACASPSGSSSSPPCRCSARCSCRRPPTGSAFS